MGLHSHYIIAVSKEQPLYNLDIFLFYQKEKPQKQIIEPLERQIVAIIMNPYLLLH